MAARSGGPRGGWTRPAALIGIGAAVAVGLVVLLVGLVEFEVIGARAASVASDVLQTLAALFAAVTCLRVGRRSERDSWVRGWQLIGLGMLAWLAGELVWSYYEVVRNVTGPELSLADAAFLALVPLTLWGLARLIALYRGAALGVLEGLIIAGSLFYLSWAVVLGRLYLTPRNTSVQWLEWVVDLSYPVGDIAIASAALILLGSVRPGNRLPVGLLAAGTWGLAFSDSIYVATADTYQTGHLADLGWILGFLLIGCAGLAARSAQRPGSTRVTDDPRTWFALPYLPLTAVAITSVLLAAAGRAPSLVLSVVLVALFGLVVVRQLLALHERRELAGHLRQQQTILNQLAYSDPLTGLANRAEFEERITAPDRLPAGTTTIMFVDLDRFKEINDAYGHDIGDAVLVATAQRLRACYPGNDMVARVGGDEFVVVAHNLAAHVVDQVAARFLTAMREPVHANGTDIETSASIGTATGDTRQVDIHELIRRADEAMYVAKVNGQGRHSWQAEPASSTMDDS
jgi:diguanylate cyclase (GGDEF)-like protein